MASDLVSPKEPPEQPGSDVPEAIGRYPVLRKLGRGGFSDVYLGRDPETRVLVALKVLREDIDPSVRDQARARFRAEEAIARAVDHPYIVRIRETSPRDERPCFIAMDYVDGVSFCEYFARLRAGTTDEKRPSRLGYYAEVARLGHEIARAMASAHARGIVHRDLKPDNVLVVVEDGAPHVRIFDFGIAKAPAELFSFEPAAAVTRHHTELGTVMGSPPYMAPEQNGAAHAVTGKADVFALGVMLLVAALGLDSSALEDGEDRVVLPANFDELVRGTALPVRMKKLLRAMVEEAAEKRPTMDEVVLGLQRAAQRDERFGAAVEAWARRRKVPSSRELLRFAPHGDNPALLTEDERLFLRAAPLARLQQLRNRAAAALAISMLAISGVAVAVTRGVRLPVPGDIPTERRASVVAARVEAPRISRAAPAISDEELAELRVTLDEQKLRLEAEDRKAAEQLASIKTLTASVAEQKRGRDQAQRQLEIAESRLHAAEQSARESRAEMDRQSQALAECRRDLEVHLGQLAEGAERLRLCTKGLREQSERPRADAAGGEPTNTN